MKQVLIFLFFVQCNFFVFSQQEVINQIKEIFYKTPVGTELAFALINKDSTYYIGLRRTVDDFEQIENEHAVFQIASVSKVFTNYLYSSAIQENLVGLQTPVSKYVKLKDKATIKMIHLANHSSGLPRLPKNMFESMTTNPTDPYKLYKEKDLLSYLKNEVEYQKKPGVESVYSNLGTGLLGYILSTIYKKTYEDLLQEKICKQLNLQNTTTDRTKIEKKLVLGKNNQGKAVQPWDFSVLVGCGGIYSSTYDLSLFLKNQMEDNGINNLMQKKTINISPNLAVGLGWHILTTNNQEEIHWHNGASLGYRSMLGMNKTQKKGVILLSNLSTEHALSDQIDKIVFDLLQDLE